MIIAFQPGKNPASKKTAVMIFAFGILTLLVFAGRWGGLLFSFTPVRRVLGRSSLAAR